MVGMMKGAEDDFDVTAEFVEIEREGSAMPAYYAAPAQAAEGTPTVVLAMHLFGVDESMRDTARRFAEAGFATIVPNLYARFEGVPNPDEKTPVASEFIPFAKSLKPETIDPDIRAATAWIRNRFPRSKTAIAGFCMGGVMALRRTIGYSATFACAAVWYGAVNTTEPERVEIPIVASYGAEDRGIPVEDVERFRDALTVPNGFAIYPDAGHAFCDHTQPSYEPRAAEDSWRRSIAFLNTWLRG